MMCCQSGSPNPRNLLPRFRQSYSQNQSNSASRGCPWNCGTVYAYLKMGVELLLLKKCLSTEVSSFQVSLIFSETVDFCSLKTCNIPLCHLVGGTPIPPIKTGKLAWGYLTAMFHSPGVLLSLYIHITCLGVQITRALLRAASVMTSIVKGIKISCGDAQQVANLLSIQGSIIMVIIGKVGIFDHFCFKSLLLVSVHFLFFPTPV